MVIEYTVQYQDDKPYSLSGWQRKKSTIPKNQVDESTCFYTGPYGEYVYRSRTLDGKAKGKTEDEEQEISTRWRRRRMRMGNKGVRTNDPKTVSQ